LFGSCGRDLPYDPLKILPVRVRLSPLPLPLSFSKTSLDIQNTTDSTRHRDC
jgi:hypothetical protein